MFGSHTSIAYQMLCISRFFCRRDFIRMKTKNNWHQTYFSSMECKAERFSDDTGYIVSMNVLSHDILKMMFVFTFERKSLSFCFFSLYLMIRNEKFESCQTTSNMNCFVCLFVGWYVCQAFNSHLVVHI